MMHYLMHYGVVKLKSILNAQKSTSKLSADNDERVISCFKMECPICFTEYDQDIHAPLVTFCCQNTICMNCVRSISAERSTSSCCPWDKRRWVGRSVLNNIMNSTPSNYFEILRKRMVTICLTFFQ